MGAESSRGRRIRAAKPTDGGAPSQALAAVLYTVPPEANDFSLSEPGTITILENGRTRFTPSPGGRHHYLVARPEQKERVLETYVKLITTQPRRLPRGRRGGRGCADALAPPSARACCSRRTISGQADEFETVSAPVLTQTCVQCHGELRPAGGMSVSGLTSSESLVQHRDVWEAILRRLRAGDMPPPGSRRPDAP